MKNKSSFVTGLIGSILGAILSFYAYFVIIVISIALAFGENTDLVINILHILTYVSMASNIVALVASILFAKNKKIAPIVMLIAFVMYNAVYIYLMFVAEMTSALNVLFIAIIPAILMLVSTILGFAKNSKTK